MPSYSGVFTLQAQMQAIAADNWPSPPLVIGQAYQGGFYAGQISTAGNGIADYNLVIGPKSTAQTSLQWKTSNTATAGTSSVITGPANTAAMIAAGAAAHPCAQFCDNLSTGGKTDWYMPAKNELEVCYYNLKPTTQVNNTSWGINANAVPARASNYTAGTPAQTSATNFQSGGTEAFDANNYWCSTSPTAYSADYVRFINGGQDNYPKTNTQRVRAIRRVAI